MVLDANEALDLQDRVERLAQEKNQQQRET